MRSPSDTEVFALKISHMLMPIERHRVRRLVRFFGYQTSVWGVALGLVGSAGFLVLLARLCLRGRRVDNDSQPQLLDVLSVLNGSATLVATTSGFGFLFSLLVTGMMRCYYRICIYLGFLALLTIALLLDRLMRRLDRGVRSRAWAYALLAVVLIGGVFDQTGYWNQVPHHMLAGLYHQDRDFVASVEAVLPPGAMVFQLPYCGFPEGGNNPLLRTYDHLRPYIHSKNIHWSFGAYKGRQTDLWQRTIVAQPTESMVRTLALAGFSGIYLDRTGYADNGVAMAATLAQLLKTRPIVRAEDRWLFFSMLDYNARLKKGMANSEWDSLSEQAKHVVAAGWGAGFSFEEELPGERWRWSDAVGELYLTNHAPFPRKIAIEMSLSTACPGPASLWIESSIFTTRLDVEQVKRTECMATLVVPPGKHTVTFRCNAPKLDVPNAGRNLVFRVHNFYLRELANEAFPPIARRVPW
jgi:phosphoglycerol transferase